VAARSRDHVFWVIRLSGGSGVEPGSVRESSRVTQRRRTGRSAHLGSQNYDRSSTQSFRTTPMRSPLGTHPRSLSQDPLKQLRTLGHLSESRDTPPHLPTRSSTVAQSHQASSAPTVAPTVAPTAPAGIDPQLWANNQALILTLLPPLQSIVPPTPKCSCGNRPPMPVTSCNNVTTSRRSPPSPAQPEKFVGFYS
jgi:hypothetical protein